MNQEETMLLHKERYKETIKNLTVMSDILARNVFKDKNACEYVLRIILEDKELTVIDNETQMDFRNMHGRGVVLDCVAKDGSGRVINVEIQQGRWKRAWKTDARLPSEGSERDAGRSLGRPRARTARDLERFATFVHVDGTALRLSNI